LEEPWVKVVDTASDAVQTVKGPLVKLQGQCPTKSKKRPGKEPAKQDFPPANKAQTDLLLTPSSPRKNNRITFIILNKPEQNNILRIINATCRLKYLTFIS
jgi:LAS superfamily LD-carboxypeptidase LdcB